MYDVSGDGVEFEVRNGEPKTIRFKSPFPSGDPAVDEARAYLYEAEGADEGVVFVHGMGRRSLFWPHYYPRMFSRCGFTPVMPVLPFHYDSVSSERDHYDRFIGGPTEVMEEKFRHAVADVCTCVEILEAFRMQASTNHGDLDECTRSFTSLEGLERIPSFFRYDPSLFAKFIDTNRVMMFSALLDPWIPPEVLG